MTATTKKCELLRVEIVRDVNEYGERAWTVTPFYRVNGRVVSVPDTKGWPTKDEAENHADEIAAR
jgi:hypothetical protein